VTATLLSDHRARLFPLPSLPPIARPLSSSARVRRRFTVRRAIVELTNRCIYSLNRLYTSPLSLASALPSSQPDNSVFSSACQPSVIPSAAQQRILALLRERCAAFALHARTGRLTGPARDVGESVLDALSSFTLAAEPAAYPSPSADAAPGDSLPVAAAPQLVDSTLLPPSSTFSSEPTPVVPLIADRVSLPEQLNIVPLTRVLPPETAAVYSSSSPALLRSTTEVFILGVTHPLRRPRVAGSRVEYVRLIGRLLAQGMISFTSAPRAVNGVFCVAKDAESDRLIIDAQPANRLFVPSPHVSLPGPSHLVQLQVPVGARMYVGKSDLSNFYHHLGLPTWMQPFFALPPLTPAELASLGLTTGSAFPCCVTLPMGFSHAVFLAQSCHEHVVYSSGSLSRTDSILHLSAPDVSSSRAVHGIVIDDFFLCSLSKQRAEAVMQGVVSSYAAAGFVVKQSKLVWPTAQPVKVIGFDIDGEHATITLPADSQSSLVQSTLLCLRSPTVSGIHLAHLIGRWTWVMMLRRPTLSVLQHVYRYIRVSQRRPFTLWKCVRRELHTLLTLLPLISTQLTQSIFHRALASDASELAAGVVSTHVSPELHQHLWPLCSARHHAVQQTRLNAAELRALSLDTSGPAAAAASIPTDTDSFKPFYSAVSAAPWRTIVSKAWSSMEHINALELRAALLALHHAFSYPSALSSRVYLLLDSTVAFFTLWKGRSSSPALLMILRKACALLLAGGMTLLPGWLPSALNPADAPSRTMEAA
jgi:hypothetical protein